MDPCKYCKNDLWLFLVKIPARFEVELRLVPQFARCIEAHQGKRPHRRGSCVLKHHSFFEYFGHTMAERNVTAVEVTNVVRCLIGRLINHHHPVTKEKELWSNELKVVSSIGCCNSIVLLEEAAYDKEIGIMLDGLSEATWRQIHGTGTDNRPTLNPPPHFDSPCEWALRNRNWDDEEAKDAEGGGDDEVEGGKGGEVDQKGEEEVDDEEEEVVCKKEWDEDEMNDDWAEDNNCKEEEDDEVEGEGEEQEGEDNEEEPSQEEWDEDEMNDDWEEDNNCKEEADDEVEGEGEEQEGEEKEGEENEEEVTEREGDTAEEGEGVMTSLQSLLISQLQELQKIGRKEGEATANVRGRREEEQSPEVATEVQSLKAQLLKALMVEKSVADLEEGESSGKETSANLEEKVRDIKYEPIDDDFLTYDPELLLKISEATKLVKVEGAGAEVIDWTNAKVVEEENDDFGDFEEDWDGDEPSFGPCPKKKFRFRRFDSA